MPILLSVYSRCIAGNLLRCYNASNVACETIRNVHLSSQHSGKVHGKFKWCKHKMSIWLREQSVQVVRACTRQFEFIAAQRIRRSVQIFHLYARIWDEVAFNNFMRTLRNRIALNAKNFIIGAVGMSVYNWEQERIADQEILSYSKEIESSQKLRDLTVVCSQCHLRLVIDVNQKGVEYCKCNNVKRAIDKAQEEGVEWEPFIEREDMLVWRKQEPDSKGLYSYKVYGTFDDVSAEDFLQVQIDMNYRKEWDATAKQLEIIDTDPLYKDSTDSCCDVIYWEMIWPRMFSNRDYVYQRRWLHDKETGTVIIVSKGTDHPNAPYRSDTYRVTTYWSFMVIKPCKDFHEQGIEFVLTYFDDPGVNIPSAVTAWVAMSGLPDYLCRMRQAGKNYKNYKLSQESENIKPDSIIITDNQDSQDDISDINNKTNDENTIILSDDIIDEKETNNLENISLLQSMSKEIEKLKDENEKEEESDSNSAQDEAQGLLDYLFLAKLFA